jgi:hypothetical protein
MSAAPAATSAAPAAQDLEELSMESTLAAEELGPEEALGEPERTRMANVNLPLDQYNLLGSVTNCVH